MSDFNKKEYNSEYRKTPKGRYDNQRTASKHRGVEFLLTFEEWWDIWEDHYDQRGRKSHELCMCRYNDEGAYEVGNVYIDTNRHNCQLRQKIKWGSLQ
jgi:hypothetical protein